MERIAPVFRETKKLPLHYCSGRMRSVRGRDSRGPCRKTELTYLEIVMSVTVTTSPAQLSWNDFLPVDSLPDGSGDEAQTAATMSEMNGISPVLTNGKFVLPDLTLAVGLDRTQTMVIKTANKTADLLKHEQGHFDITVLTVRALAAELEQLKAGSVPSLGQHLNAARSKHQQRANMITEKYDKETENSRNQALQKTWNDAIDATMKASSTTILRGMPL